MSVRFCATLCQKAGGGLPSSRLLATLAVKGLKIKIFALHCYCMCTRIVSFHGCVKGQANRGVSEIDNAGHVNNNNNKTLYFPLF
jgi:hypothetical protein